MCTIRFALFLPCVWVGSLSSDGHLSLHGSNSTALNRSTSINYLLMFSKKRNE